MRGTRSQEMIEDFPSVQALRKMGVKNFKPSVHHLVSKMNNISNICNNPMLDGVTPRVMTHFDKSEKLPFAHLIPKIEIEEPNNFTDGLKR